MCWRYMCLRGSFPRVPPHWEQVIFVSMDPDSLTAFGRERLNERLAEHGRRCSNISSMLEAFDLIEEPSIDGCRFSVRILLVELGT